MRDVYEYCPQFENEKFLLRLISADDVADLLKAIIEQISKTAQNYPTSFNTSFKVIPP